MDKNELPARVLSDSGLLFHDDVPPVVLRTFARLYALAWKHHYDRTDRLKTDELLVLLDLTMRSLYRHLAALRKLGVYYTAAIEPVRAWGCDAWGVCQTCGRVACAGHDPVGEGDVGEAEIYWGASNGTSRSENSRENRIRRAWPAVAEYIRECYRTEIRPVEIGDYEVKVTFPGDERGAVVNRARSMLKRAVDGFVDVIDAGPV